MGRSAENLEGYLRETLHTQVTLERWRGAADLPAYLKGQYEFFDGTVGDARILFLQSPEEPVPSVAKKHERALGQHWAGPVAFTFERITPRTRQRMVSEGLLFVVPGNQVYLPVLGMNLREKYQTRTRTSDRLRPSAQVLFLYLLANRSPSSNMPSGVAKLLGYSAMAMGQGLDQLEEANLVRVHKVGRERRFELAGDPADLWLQAQSLLASPVSRTFYLVSTAAPVSNGLEAGLSALAGYSALAAPRVRVVALAREQAKTLPKAPEVHELPSEDEADLGVEVWAYEPSLLSDGPAVDRLSLYLSLRGDTDERVSSALDEMMRGVQW